MQTRQTPSPTFRALIDHVIDHGILTRQQLALAAQCDPETIRRWVQEDQKPRWDHFRNMHSRNSLLPEDFKAQLLHFYMQTSDYEATFVGQINANELDINKDGKVDTQDVEAFTLNIMGEAVRGMQLRRTRWQNGLPTEEQKAEDRASLHELIKSANMALAALDYQDGSRMRIGTKTA